MLQRSRTTASSASSGRSAWAVRSRVARKRRKRKKGELSERDRALVPPRGERPRLRPAEPCDFERVRLELIPEKVWALLENDEAEAVRAAFVRYARHVQLALRATLLNRAPTNVAAAAGVSPSAVRHWRRLDAELAADFARLRAIGRDVQARRRAWREAVARERAEEEAAQAAAEEAEAERRREWERRLPELLERERRQLEDLETS